MARRKDKQLVGAHVSPEHPLTEADELGADCVQVFLSDPQGWRKPADRGDAEELRASAVPLYVHSPYLVNVCSPRNNVRYGSRKVLQQTCDAAATVGAAAFVIHPGHAEDGIAAGIGRWGRTLEMLEADVPLFIENTAGKGTMGADVLPFGRTVQNPQIARETHRSMSRVRGKRAARCGHALSRPAPPRGSSRSRS